MLILLEIPDLNGIILSQMGVQANHMNPLCIGNCRRVAGQLGLKSSRPLSQVGPGSTPPESTRPCVFSEYSVTYMYPYMYIIYIYGLGFE